MSSSPEPILRGEIARAMAAADFDVDLRSAVPVPSAMVAVAQEAARATGYAEGWAQGQRAARVSAQAVADQQAAAWHAADQAREAAAGRALAAVAKAAADLDTRETPALEAIADAVLSAAVDIAEALLGYEVANAESAPDGSTALAAIRRAMSLVPDGGPVTVRLYPDDYATVVGRGDTGLTAGRPAGTPGTGVPRRPATGDATYAFEGRAITVRADATLSPGDAVAEYGVTTVDATLAAAVARVREALAR